MRFVDSNVLLYHLADDPRYGKKASGIMERIEGGEPAATSTLVISQVCGYLRWKKRQDAIPAFVLFLRSLPSLSKISTEFADIVGAQEFSVQHKLDGKLWDDVVITIQMMRMSINEIYSNDTDFDTIPGIKRVFE